MYRFEHGGGRLEDLDVVMDLCDNISPGVTWPPAQTTICVLGPSIPSAVKSSIEMFRDDYLAHIQRGGCTYE
jgi:NADH-quinone oxidoreductase subunit F